MGDASTNPYLRDAVLTAPPEQLQLMLYDGAIRFAHQGRDALEAGHPEKTYDALTRAQKIVLELINGLREEVDPPLVGQVSAVYMFIYRKLVEANVNKDVAAVDDALNLLRYQRETWVLLLEKLRAEQAEAEPAPDAPSPSTTQVAPDAATAPGPGVQPPAQPPADRPDYQTLSVEG